MVTHVTEIWQTEWQFSIEFNFKDAKLHSGNALQHYTHSAFIRGPAFRKLPSNDHCGLGGPLYSEVLWNICWVHKRKKKKKRKRVYHKWMDHLYIRKKGKQIKKPDFSFLLFLKKKRKKKLFFPCNAPLGRKVSVTVSCDWLWEGQRDWLGHTARKTHGQQTHGAQGCTYWLAIVGSANPAHHYLWTTSIWWLTTDPCGPNANWSYTSTKSGLALPTWCCVGKETNPKHSMLTVLSGASVGCHATSCPVEGQGDGEWGSGRGRELGRAEYLKPKIK